MRVGSSGGTAREHNGALTAVGIPRERDETVLRGVQFGQILKIASESQRAGP